MRQGAAIRLGGRCIQRRLFKGGRRRRFDDDSVHLRTYRSPSSPTVRRFLGPPPPPQLSTTTSSSLLCHFSTESGAASNNSNKRRNNARRRAWRREISQRLEQCQTVQDVADFHRREKTNLNASDLKECWFRVRAIAKKSMRGSPPAPEMLLLRPLVLDTTQRIHKLGFKKLCHLLNTMAQLRTTSFDAGQDFWFAAEEEALRLYGTRWSNREVAMLAWSFAKVGHGSSMLFEAIEDYTVSVIEREVDSFSPQDLSTISWAFAKQRRASSSPELFWAIERAAVPRLREFNPQDLSSLAWSFATTTAGDQQQHPELCRSSPLLFGAIAKVSAARVNDFSSQTISNLVWSLATAGQAAPEFFDAIAGLPISKLEQFNPQSLANTAWAFAKLQHSCNSSCPLLLSKMAEVSMSRLDQFRAQGLSNLVWSYATLGQKSPQLFDAVADEALHRGRLKEFSSQALSNMVWSYATLDHPAPALFDAVAEQALHRLPEFDEQALSNTVWAFATLGHTDTVFFNAIADQAIPRLSKFSAQNLSNTAWAFARLGHYSPPLFDGIAAECVQQRSISPQHASNLALAFAIVRHDAPVLFDALVTTAASRDDLREFTNQGLANMAWAYAVANHNTTSSLWFRSDDFAARCEGMQGDPECLRQLHQWLLWQEECGNPKVLSEPLRAACHDAFVAEEGVPSKIQQAVKSCLASMGLAVEEEVRTPSGYSIDLMVTTVDGGTEIAVEVDGPSHFLAKSRRPTGSTILKHRQVRALDGLLLVSIPYWEWEETAARDAEKKSTSYCESYLRHKLKDCLGAESSIRP